jgi:uncharacterized membrane protein YciS (DUF1049 family)
MLVVLAAASETDESGLVATLLGIALVVIFISFFFFVMRWQIRLFNDLRDSLRRIADAIEALAQRR